MLTRPEFLRGWLLLTSQPWGRTYRSEIGAVASAEPSPAKIQAELYYKALHQQSAAAWIEACETLAAGDHWPNLGEVREALRHTKAQRPSADTIEHRLGFVTKEEFGMDAFSAIYAASARQQCLQNADVFRGKGLSGQAAIEEKKAQEHFRDLEAAVSKETIAPADLTKIMELYGC